MGSLVKILVPAALMAIAVFVYILNRDNKKRGKFADMVKKDFLSYEDIIADVQEQLKSNDANYDGKKLKMQILSNNTVQKMADFLDEEDINVDFNATNNVGLIILANNSPAYIKIYSYNKLSQDLIDVLPSNGIYEQEIEF